MNRTLILALTLLCGCTTRLRYDYFEPAGLGSTISSPPQAPKNIATLPWHGCTIQVGATVSEQNLIVVKLWASLPPGTQLAFSGDQATLSVGKVEEQLTLTWQESTLREGVGERREIAFGAPLKAQSFATRPSGKGIESTGNYETEIVLPAKYSATREFALALPAPVGHAPIRMTFIRKTADYKVFVPLQ